MISRFLCWLGIHAWESGNDGHGIARWCERCDHKQVLRAGGLIRNFRGNLMPTGMRWEDEEDDGS